MKRAVAEKSITQNPTLQILYTNDSRLEEPYIDIEYTDGTKLKFPTRKYNEHDILLKVGKHTQKLRRDDL